MIRNLDFTATEDDLKKLTDHLKGVLSIRIIKDKITNKSKGFGFIDFENEEFAKIAMKINGIELKRRKISVEYSAPKSLRMGQKSARPKNLEAHINFKGSIVDL